MIQTRNSEPRTMKHQQKRDILRPIQHRSFRVKGTQKGREKKKDQPHRQESTSFVIHPIGLLNNNNIIKNTGKKQQQQQQQQEHQLEKKGDDLKDSPI